MPNQREERRTRLVVNRPLQGRLVADIALLPALTLAGIAVCTGIYLHRVMDEAVATDSELPNVMPLFYLVIVFELLAAVLLVVNSLKISHRIAGPAYRICDSLDRVRAGDLTVRVKLRDGDHLRDIGDRLNGVIDWLNQNPPPGATTRAMAAAAPAEEPRPHDAPAPATQRADQTS